jgi:LPXTG-site transpeptidase (sortase) family protein
MRGALYKLFFLLGIWLIFIGISELRSGGQEVASGASINDGASPASIQQLASSPPEISSATDGTMTGMEPILAPITQPVNPSEQAQAAYKSGSPIGTSLIAETAKAMAKNQAALTATLAEQPPLAEIPNRLVIPAIHLDAPVVLVQKSLMNISGTDYQTWQAPNEFAAGWLESSAMLGEAGNLVLSGHHNIDGMVFAHLVDLQEGDMVEVYGPTRVVRYRVTQKLILPEKNEPLQVRLENARWIEPTPDQRLTLVTCWPFETNTHRLIIIAQPE